MVFAADVDLAVAGLAEEAVVGRLTGGPLVAVLGVTCERPREGDETGASLVPEVDLTACPEVRPRGNLDPDLAEVADAPPVSANSTGDKRHPNQRSCPPPQITGETLTCHD